MNFGQNLYQWFLSNAQSLVLMAIVVIGIYLGFKREFSKLIGFLVVALIAVGLVFNAAESFAREKSGGKKVTYTNPIAVAKNGGWRYSYGNQFYVELVNQYLAVPQISGELAQKVMNEALKYQGWKYVYGGSKRELWSV